MNPLIDKCDDIFNATKYYLNPFTQYWINRDEAEKEELKQFLGAGGPIKYWRKFQIAVNKKHSEFEPDGMRQYIEDNSKANNSEAQKILSSIELYLKDDIAMRLENHYGENWVKKGVPSKLFFELQDSANKKNYDEEDETKHIIPWECMYLIKYRDILQHASNWRDIFEKLYTRSEHKKGSYNKDTKTKWVVDLNVIRDDCFRSHRVSKNQLIFLQDLEKWLFNKDG